MIRRWTLPLVVLLLLVVAFGIVVELERRADQSRRAQLHIGSVQAALTDLLDAPFNANPQQDGSGAPARARVEIATDEQVISHELMHGSDTGPRRPPAERICAGSSTKGDL